MATNTTKKDTTKGTTKKDTTKTDTTKTNTNTVSVSDVAKKRVQMEAAKNEAVALCCEYNDARAWWDSYINGDKPEGEFPRKLVDIDADIQKKTAEYNKHSREVFYDECMSTPNPTLTAIKTLQYRTITAKDKKEKGSDDMALKIENADTYVDIWDFCSSRVKNTAKWVPTLERINYAMYQAYAGRVDATLGNYKIDAQALAVTLTYEGKPLENDDEILDKKGAILRENLQMLADLMMGKDVVKVEDRDANAVSMDHGGWGKKKFSIRTNDDHKFCMSLTRALSRAAVNGEYTVENANLTN